MKTRFKEFNYEEKRFQRFPPPPPPAKFRHQQADLLKTFKVLVDSRDISVAHLRFKCHRRQHCLVARVAHVWNRLPADVLAANSAATFKMKLEEL